MKTFAFATMLVLTIAVLVFGARPSIAAEREGNGTRVIAEGAGVSAEEALNDAFRNAVRQVVGVYVDSETLVKNERMVDDVLTYSNGFVSSYHVVEESHYRGLHRRKIMAVVERSPLMKRLRENKIVDYDLDGKGLLAETRTRQEAKRNATGLLQRALEGFPANVLQAEVLETPKVAFDSENHAQVSCQVRVSVDPERYAAFRKQLMKVLDKLATHRGGLTALSATVPTRYHERGNDVFKRQFLGGSHWREAEDSSVGFSRFQSIRKTGITGLPDNWHERRYGEERPLLFVVHTGERGIRNTRWRWFEVAVPAPLPHGPLRIEMKYVGTSGEVVASDSFQFGGRIPGISMDDSSNDNGLPLKILLSPYLLAHSGSGYGAKTVVYTKEMVVERAIDLPYSGLGSVESVSCTVAMPAE